MLEAASFTDPLTGLGNRRSLDVAVPGLIDSVRYDAERNQSPARLAMLLVDLDRLKPINDQFGHEAGDLLLKEVAKILRDCVREDDKIVRWGGDEFVVIHRTQGLEGAVALAERIRYRVSKRRFQVGASEVGRTSCSIGFALYPFVPGVFLELGWERALGVADSNMYRAKATRNAWVGCAGLPAARELRDLESRAQDDLEAVERQALVEVRRSAPAIGETVELLLRRPTADLRNG
jgi:diguanylate cyclase (GGDEF)-like protein